MKMEPYGLTLLDYASFSFMEVIMSNEKKLESKKIVFVSVFTILFLLITSCQMSVSPKEVNLNQPETEIEQFDSPEIKNRKWTILIYMSADNNLESAALDDIYEMETSKIDTNEVSIFALVDRSDAYDTSENNWSGTRLYKINTNRNVEQKNIISQQVECPPLGLYQGQTVELDMSSGYVLSNCLGYLMEKFPADDYGFIMWGHGTGWRNDSTLNTESDYQKLFKGFAFDDSSKTYMTLKQLGDAISVGLDGKKLSFMGFDTCFGGELEIMYELRNNVEYCVASEGLVSASGWNYTELFNIFRRCREKNTEELCSSVIEQFRKQYSNKKRASIVSINMREIENYYTAFDDFTGKVAEMVKTKEDRNAIMGILYANNDCKTEKYSYGSANSDIFLDSFSMITELNSFYSSSFKNEYESIKEIKDKTIVQNWSSDSEEGGLGVYFSTLQTSGIINAVLPSSYIKEKTFPQIEFVSDSNGYVPTEDKNISLLDKLFYTQYE